MANIEIKGMLKCDWDGDEYAKLVVAYNSTYWVHDENWGGTALADINSDYINIDGAGCWDTGISVDIPLSECGQEILDEWMESIYDEQDVDCYPDKSTFCIEY